jgi:hypothetical protein
MKFSSGLLERLNGWDSPGEFRNDKEMEKATWGKDDLPPICFNQ